MKILKRKDREQYSDVFPKLIYSQRSMEQSEKSMPVYKDKKGKWYVSKRYIDWKGEQQRHVKRGFSTQREAKAYEAKFVSSLNTNPTINFDEFVEIYYADRKAHLKENTFITKKNIVEKNIRPYFKNYRLNEITPAVVVHWQTVIMNKDIGDGKKYANAMLKTIHAQLSAIFNHAMKYYGLTTNPACAAGSMGKAEKKEMKFWTLDEYRAFSKEIMDKPISYHAFEMLYWCGLRIGEMLALTPEDFDFDKKRVRINKSFQCLHGKEVITSPKTLKSNRYVDLPDFLAKEMKDYIGWLYGVQSTERIFPVSKGYMHHEMDRGTKLSGVKRIRIHDLRHSHISLLIEKGFSAVAIADRVGHETIRITYQYAHLFPSKGVEMANSLNEDMEENYEFKKQ